MTVGTLSSLIPCSMLTVSGPKELDTQRVDTPAAATWPLGGAEPLNLSPSLLSLHSAGSLNTKSSKAVTSGQGAGAVSNSLVAPQNQNFIHR